MPKEREVVKVELTYSDGTVVRLEGKDLELWMNTVESAMLLAHMHGWVPDSYKELWERIEARVKKNKRYP